jgi:hypothetical protein
MMPGDRWLYVNRSALIDKELSMTASNVGRTSAVSSQQKQDVTNCRPMSHQNSGDHGHEMHPQQFVRLIGCHDVHAPPAREEQEGRLH